MINMFRSASSSLTVSSDGLNHIYNYAVQNPLKFVDLYGLDIYRVCRDQNALIGQTCRACIKVVCSLPAVSKLCCKLDFDGCIADSNGNPQKMSDCAAKEIACALKRENKLPKKEPKDGEI
jgi:hypothetical protein